MSIKLHKASLSALLISTLAATTTHAAIGQKAASTSVKTVGAKQLKNTSEIDDVFAQYQYEMDGWNGSYTTKKDADLRLSENLANLVAAGFTVEQIQAAMENKIISAAKKNEYRQVVESLKIQNASQEKIAQTTLAFMKDSSATGAAFGSGVGINYKKLAIIVGAFIVTAVTVIIIKKYIDSQIKKGIDGKDGVNGKDGADGKDGTNGTNGTDGKDGTNGTNGTDGTDGTNGTNGTNGTDGTNGTNGTNGLPGAPGLPGTPGTPGTPGAPGPQGPAGPQGPQGPAGASCPTGFNWQVHGVHVECWWTGSDSYHPELHPSNITVTPGTSKTPGLDAGNGNGNGNG